MEFEIWLLFAGNSIYPNGGMRDLKEKYEIHSSKDIIPDVVHADILKYLKEFEWVQIWNTNSYSKTFTTYYSTDKND